MPALTCLAHRLGLAALLAGSVFGAGCTTTGVATASSAITVPPEPDRDIGPILQESEPSPIPVARYGRYTLVELVPEPAQRDLLQQVIEVSMPPMSDASIGDALRHLLLRTGYRLCDTPQAAALYALSLPAAHLRLGPLPLHDALLVLAGPAWELSVDDASRTVCFSHAPSPRATSASPVPAPPASSATVAEPAQPEEAQP